MKYFIGVVSGILMGVVLLMLTVMGGCQLPRTPTDLKPLIDQYVEVWNTGDIDKLDAVVDPGFKLRMTPTFEAAVGIDSLKHTISYWRTAYPDFHITIDEEIYAEDAITARWTITATNSGPGRWPPTGKQVTVPGVSILHVANGRIIDEWIAGNNLFWLEQLGFTLIPPQDAEE